MFNLSGQGLTVRIGSLFRIPVFLHYSTLLIPLFLLITGNINFIFVYFLAYICVLLHELGHAAMAKRFGHRSHCITILPIGCVVSIDGQSKKKFEEFLIALAGPLTTLVTIFILYFFRNIAIVKIIYSFSWIIFIFNMIPMFPLDGGRMCRSLLEMKFTTYIATKTTVILTYILLGIFTIYSIINFSIFNFIIIAFIFLYAKKEYDRVCKNYKATQGFLNKARKNTVKSRLKHVRGE